MGLNIKNEEAQHLATELTALTGETLTGAVIVALRERIAQLRQ
jgi:antitoxin VapB